MAFRRFREGAFTKGRRPDLRRRRLCQKLRETGESYAEIARLLGVTRQAVHSMCKRSETETGGE